ncbi:NUDIX hydrolase [Candidatus Roizmanbacteria bacterium]|nr:MAG: NUDIX hydrolase [Candidatus Roizmanbacteria bacterium]
MPHTFQPVILAVIEQDGKYLFTKRIDDFPDYHGKWQLSGGGLEFGENPVEGLRRELREELGVEVTDVKIIPFVDTRVRNDWQGVFISFHCHLENPDAEIYLNEEASEYRWFEKSEIDYSQFPIFEGCVEIVQKLV